MLIHDTTRPLIYPLGRSPVTGAFRDLAHHPQDETEPGLLVLRVEQLLYFGNARTQRDTLLRQVDASQPPPRVVLVDLAAVPEMDLTASHALRELHEDLAGRGIQLWFAAFALGPRTLLHRAGLWKGLATEHRLFATVSEAIETYRLNF